MHKGRWYPFHPNYWSAPAWFWPGFVPWKLRAVDVPIGVTMFGCPAGTPIVISDPGIPSDDSMVIDYFIPLAGGCAMHWLGVTMERVGGLGSFEARWTVGTEYWDGSREYQSMNQEYPQREVLSPVFSFTIPPMEVGPPIVVHPRFFPATYAEGGSPWPRVPEGPPMMIDLANLTPEA